MFVKYQKGTLIGKKCHHCGSTGDLKPVAPGKYVCVDPNNCLPKAVPAHD